MDTDIISPTNTVQLVDKYAEKLGGAFTKLAEKAGVAAEHFWPVFIKNEIINGVTNVSLFIIAIILVLTIIYSLINKKTGVVCKENIKESEIPWIVIRVILGILFLIAICINSSNLGSQISRILNPEYAAIKSLSSLIK